MFEGIVKFFKKLIKQEAEETKSKDTAKERLHLVLMQDRANVSADFLELMKQEIIDVIKKYIEVDESAIDVRLTNKNGEDGENGAPALYANIPIINIRNDMKKVDPSTGKIETKAENKISGQNNQADTKAEIKEDTKQDTRKTEKIEDTESKNQKNERIEEKKKEDKTGSIKDAETKITEGQEPKKESVEEETIRENQDQKSQTPNKGKEDNPKTEAKDKAQN